MKRYVREFAADLKRQFTPLANPRIRQDYFEEIDRIVAHCERGRITAPEAVKALCSPERINIPTPLGLIVAEAQHNAAYDGVTIFLSQDHMMVKIGAFVCPHGKDLIRAELFSDLNGFEATATDYIGRPQVNAFFDRCRDFDAMFK